MQKQQENEGFSLLELVVVVAVLAVLSAIAMPSFICFPKRAKATAALAALRQIKTECVYKSNSSLPEVFTPSSLNGYTIQSDGSNSCTGWPASGLVSIVPDNASELPTFNFSSITRQLTYSFRGKTGTDFIDCLAMMCGSGNGSFNRSMAAKNALKQQFESEDFVVKETYIERGCSAYVVVEGGTWEATEANAKKIGGHLATISDKGESQWIATEFSKEKYFYDGDSNPGDPDSWSHFWIGANDKNAEGKLEWSSGEGFSFNEKIEDKDLRENNQYPNRDYVSMILNVTSPGSYDWNIGENNHDPSMNNDFRGLAEIPTCEE